MEDSMKPEKFHAADYTPTEVEAAKRVMIEVAAQNLGEGTPMLALLSAGGCLNCCCRMPNQNTLEALTLTLL